MSTATSEAVNSRAVLSVNLKKHHTMSEVKHYVLPILGAVIIYKGLTGLIEASKAPADEVPGATKGYRKPGIASTKKIQAIIPCPKDNAYLGLPRWQVIYADGYRENLFKRTFPSDYYYFKTY